jgi:hypothetical protein
VIVDIADHSTRVPRLIVLLGSFTVTTFRTTYAVRLVIAARMASVSGKSISRLLGKFVGKERQDIYTYII